MVIFCYHKTLDSFVKKYACSVDFFSMVTTTKPVSCDRTIKFPMIPFPDNRLYDTHS